MACPGRSRDCMCCLLTDIVGCVVVGLVDSNGAMDEQVSGRSG